MAARRASSIDRDLLIAAGRLGGRMLIGALGGILDEADVVVKNVSTEAQRRVARAKAKLETMRKREAASRPTYDNDDEDDGENPYGV